MSKKRKPPLNFSAWIGHYPYKVGFSIGGEASNLPGIARRMRLWNGEGIFQQPESNGCCWEFEDGKSLIWLKEHPDRASRVGILAHECVHAVENAARHIGYGCHEASEEFRAYAQQFLVETALKRCWK